MYNISICGYHNIFKRPWFLYHINFEIFWCKKIDQRPKHVVLWNFLFGFFAPETSLTFLLKRKKKFKKNCFALKCCKYQFSR